MERSWLTRLGLSLNARTVTGVRAYRRSYHLWQALGKPGVQVVGLRIYSTPKLAPSLTPVLILAVARPAYSLRHQLKSVLPYLTTGQKVNAYYLRIVDGQGKRVLEWDGSSLRGETYSVTSLYVRPGLRGCSPISILEGRSGRVPPCPSK